MLTNGSPTSLRRRACAVGLTLATAAAVGMIPAPASAVVNDPPANDHSILSFPVRDFVSADGYARTDKVTVEILRGGFTVGTAANLVPTDDPKTAAFDGIVEVNHPGGGCWEGVTPDLRPGDVVRLTTASGQVDQTHVADVAVTQPATNVGGTIIEKGTAANAAGTPLPAAQLEARIIANRLSFDVNGKRDLRAPGDGTIAYDAPGSTHWTATWKALDAHDQDQATSGESRSLWLGTDPLAINSLGSPSEGTLYEFGQVPGPAAPCTAPLATGPTTPDLTPTTDSGASSTDDVTSNNTPTFTGVTGLAPAGATVRLYVDGSVNGSGVAGTGGTYNLTPDVALADGVHNISASEVDPTTGVETRSSAALSVTIDTAAPAAPTVSSVSPASPGTSTTPAISGTAEPRSSVTLFTDTACTTAAGSGSAATFGAGGVASTVASGSTTSFSATATDTAGNASPCSSSSVSYVQDSVPPPAPTIDTAPASPTNNSGPGFTFSDAEAGATFACSMTTGADDFGPCTSPTAYSNLPDGSYTFKVRARDAAGNTSTTARALAIDTVLPTVTLNSPPADPTGNNSPAFSFSSKPGSTFSCSMSRGADSFSPCTSPVTFSALPDGRYTFKVAATDRAGNVGAATAYGLTVDTVAPGATVTGMPPNPSAVNTPTFEFASADVSAKFSCSLTLASSTLDNYQPCVSPVAYPTRADGNWVFKVRATDAAGNTGAPDTYAFTINTAPKVPVATFDSTGVTFAATDVGTAAASRTVRLTNTGTASLSIANIAITGLNAGDYTQTHPTCGASLAVGSSCDIVLTFKPTAPGSRTASLSVADNTTGSPHIVALTGNGIQVDATAPTVTAKTPAGTGVALGTTTTRTPVRATFSENVTGVSGTTFTLKQGTTSVPAAVSYDAGTKVATLTPDLPLTADKTYTAALTAGVKDAAGNPLTALTWKFVTGPRPTVTAKSPAVGATGVALGTTTTRTPVRATFSENVTGVSATTFTLKQGTTSVPAAVSYNATTHVATLTPNQPLTADKTYTAALTAGVKDSAGNPLTALTWKFITGPRPTVTAKSPAAGATGISRTANVTATLSETVTGLSTTTFTLKQGTTPVTAVVSYNATTKVATLNPNATLAPNTRFTASLNSGVKDTAGNTLGATTWTFTTGP
jgi:Bacterial Ig-like domain